MPEEASRSLQRLFSPSPPPPVSDGAGGTEHRQVQDSEITQDELYAHIRDQRYAAATNEETQRLDSFDSGLRFRRLESAESDGNRRRLSRRQSLQMYASILQSPSGRETLSRLRGAGILPLEVEEAVEEAAANADEPLGITHMRGPDHGREGLRLSSHLSC